MSQTAATRMRLTYGLDIISYKVMAMEQGDRCAICREPKRLVIDHDHVTGEVRGLLCQGCNTGLGKLGDTIEGLERALAYLRAHAA